MVNELLELARKFESSDLHLTVGVPPVIRINGNMVKLDSVQPLDAETIETIAREITFENGIRYVKEQRDYDFCYVDPNGLRNRVNIFTQKKCRSISIRLLYSYTPTIDKLSLPFIFKDIAMMARGLVLVTGPAGSGKSTTLAAMTEHINTMKCDHILTIEDPIEYIHKSNNSIINQREIGSDVEDFAAGLRSALREDPDVILVGEMRDLETISATLTASETGHLVMSTLHTIGAAKTIDRIIDVFPPHQQSQVRVQLATSLRAVITQILLPRADGKGRVPAFEIMVVNDAISNLIRESKNYQINSVIQTNTQNGMVLLDSYLAELAKKGVISMEVALENCVSKDALRRLL